MTRISAWQAAFNQQLTAALKSLKSDFSAFWWLGGASFLYGIVHAAGPGHGKVVISSYLLANEQRVRSGIAIASVSALVQAVVAVGVVGLMAVLLNMTSMAITDTAKLFETGSFALVVALGLYLLARKGSSAWAVLRGGDPHSGHHHHHGHAHGRSHAGIQWEEPRPAAREQAPAMSGCSCGHQAAPAGLERRGLSGAAVAVMSVGLRPCSGALVVLVFALAQGVFWAGVASTFLMAVGTAITVAILAAIAVGAKDLAGRLARGNDRRSSQVMLALELVAALFITSLGAVLFVGSLNA